MKSIRYEGSEVRRVLSAMATDATVLSRVAARWTSEGLFAEPYANLVGGWCVKHLQRYGEPPNGRLRDLVDRWAAKGDRPDETVRMVERFLEAASDEHSRGDPINVEYALDEAQRHFDRVQVRRAVEEAEEELEAGKVDEARRRLTSLTPMELGTGTLVRASTDYEPWAEAWDEDRMRPLIEYPDEAEKFFRGCFRRGNLLSFMAPDKSFKSFWLLDLAFRAVKARCRTAFFDVGDNDRQECLLRLGCRVLRRPKDGGIVTWPLRVGRGEDGKVKIKTESRSLKGVTPGEAFKALARLCRGRDMLRMSCHPNSSISADGIGGMLRDWAREGWVADAVAIDYADILAPPTGYRETLDQIDATWRCLRRLSQELHCLVVTASQSSALAYKDGNVLMAKKHFSGRKTKLAHVNGMIGLYVGPEDRERGISRLNWVVRRDTRYNERHQMIAAGCLDCGCPLVVARG